MAERSGWCLAVAALALSACSGSTGGGGSSGAASSSVSASSGASGSGATTGAAGAAGSGAGAGAGSTGGGGTCSPTVFSPSNGDIGTPCTGAPTDGGIAQGSCSASELCLSLDGDGDFRCTADCSQQGCPGSAICYAMTGMSNTIASFCIAGCTASASGSCPSGQACYVQTPNPSEVGECFAACQAATDCQYPDAGTSFSCASDGSCHCGQDSDCVATGAGDHCDVTSGACYTACDPTSASACDDVGGCCAQTGSLSYCDEYGETGATGTTGTTGTSGTTGTTGTTGTSGSFSEGAHTPWPTLVNHGGNVIANPELITITFNEVVLDGGGMGPYPYQSQVEAFDQWLVTSPWIQAWGPDYGVGMGTWSAADAVRVNDTPAAVIVDSAQQHQVGSYLVGLIQAGTVPMPTANSIYTIFYPASVAVYTDDEKTQGSCSVFTGYHSSYQTADGTQFAYSVINDCGPESGLSDGDTITGCVGHETAEASTEPFTNPQGLGTWSLTDTTSPWFYTGGEVGDLCFSNYYTDPTTQYVAQRIWSISAARAGGSPCLPLATGSPPFLGFSAGSQIIFAAAGQDATVTVQGWSTADSPPWDVTLDYQSGPISTAMVQAASPADGDNLTTSLSNGQTVTFTVSVPASASSGQYAFFQLDPDLMGVTGDTDPWPVVVEVP